jgi:hypothetical protein
MPFQRLVQCARAVAACRYSMPVGAWRWQTLACLQMQHRLLLHQNLFGRMYTPGVLAVVMFLCSIAQLQCSIAAPMRSSKAAMAICPLSRQTPCSSSGLGPSGWCSILQL